MGLLIICNKNRIDDCFVSVDLLYRLLSKFPQWAKIDVLLNLLTCARFYVYVVPFRRPRTAHVHARSCIMNSVYSSSRPRVSNGRMSPGLPVHHTTSSAVQEKRYRNSSSWLISIPLQLPGTRVHFHLCLPNPRYVHQSSTSRFGRVKGSIILGLGCLWFLFSIFALAKRFGTRERKWPSPFLGDPPTLIYRRKDLQRIWQWEVASGHYPSHHPSKLLTSRMIHVFLTY